MSIEETYENLLSVVEELSEYLDRLEEEEEDDEEVSDKYIDVECCFYLTKTALEKLQPYV